jgi:HSP20 family protein
MLNLHRSTWNPWKDFSVLQREMGRAFQEAFGSTVGRGGTVPPVNVWKGEDGLVVTAPVPGVDLSDIEISVLKDTLTIRVQPANSSGESEGTVHRHERHVEPFVRSLVLPFEVDVQRTEAKYEKGVLSIKLHRPDALKPTKVTVQAA